MFIVISDIFLSYVILYTRIMSQQSTIPPASSAGTSAPLKGDSYSTYFQLFNDEPAIPDANELLSLRRQILMLFQALLPTKLNRFWFVKTGSLPTSPAKRSWYPPSHEIGQLAQTKS